MFAITQARGALDSNFDASVQVSLLSDFGMEETSPTISSKNCTLVAAHADSS